MVAWWHNVAFVNTFIVGREREKKKKNIFQLFPPVRKRNTMSVLFRGKITRCWSQRCDRISWQTWVKLATMGNVGEKQFVSLQGENASSLVADRIVPLRNVCTMILFCLFILGGGLTLLYDSQERHNFALHLHNSLQEKRCISDLFPQWRRLIISFRRRECDRWINDVDHRGQEGAELWFTKCQLRSRALSGDRGDTIADTSRRNTFPSQSLSVSSGTGWTDWISRRSRAKKKKKKAGWGGSNVWSACRTPACLSYNLWDMSQ